MVDGEPPVPDALTEAWRRQLTEAAPLTWQRRLQNRVPSNPRCKMCAAPFAGIGGQVMRRLGRARWPKNPKYCRHCFGILQAHHGGAEVECSLLFADVRGSTTLAEGMSASEFTRLMERFFGTATTILVDEGALVDKFVGDEVIGIFIPAMATEKHAAHAVGAARRLLAATARRADGDPGLPIGIGVNTAVAYVGSVGDELNTEMTAMGDAVNTTARLSSRAGAGEALVTVESARKAGLDLSGVETRALELKGKSQPTQVVVLRA